MEVLENTASGLLASLACELIISSRKKKNRGIKEKERLEELLVVIHSVIDAAKVHVISSRWLRNWLKKLKGAAAQGDKALLMVDRLVENIKQEKNRIKNPPESSPCVGWDRVLSPIFVAHTFAKKLWFNEDDTTEILRTALCKVERACRNAKLFLRLLKLESKRNSCPGIAVNSVRLARRCKVGSEKRRSKLGSEKTFRSYSF